MSREQILLSFKGGRDTQEQTAALSSAPSWREVNECIAAPNSLFSDESHIVVSAQ